MGGGLLLLKTEVFQWTMRANEVRAINSSTFELTCHLTQPAYEKRNIYKTSVTSVLKQMYRCEVCCEKVKEKSEEKVLFPKQTIKLIIVMKTLWGDNSRVMLLWRSPASARKACAVIGWLSSLIGIWLDDSVQGAIPDAVVLQLLCVLIHEDIEVTHCDCLLKSSGADRLESSRGRWRMSTLIEWERTWWRALTQGRWVK